MDIKAAYKSRIRIKAAYKSRMNECVLQAVKQSLEANRQACEDVQGFQPSL